MEGQGGGTAVDGCQGEFYGESDRLASMWQKLRNFMKFLHFRPKRYNIVSFGSISVLVVLENYLAGGGALLFQSPLFLFPVFLFISLRQLL